jgi:hypothetical protein
MRVLVGRYRRTLWVSLSVLVAAVIALSGTASAQFPTARGSGPNSPEHAAQVAPSNGSTGRSTQPRADTVVHLGPTLIKDDLKPAPGNHSGNVTSLTATHTKFGGIFNSAGGGSSYCGVLGNYCEISKIVMNITTPQSGGSGDTLFEGMSVYDSAGFYDQIGIATGDWQNNGGGTVPECVSSFAWCLYYSFANPGSNGCSVTYYGIMDGYLLRDTSYELKIYDDPSNGAIYYYAYQITSTGLSLVDQGDYYTGGTYFYLASTFGVGECFYDDYTNYEEWVDGDLNSVQAWPAFNFHTTVYAEDVTSMSWSQYSISTPSGFTGALISTFFNYDWSWMNVTNEPFRMWVGVYFGEGMENISVSNTHSNSFNVDLNAVADPNSGYSVTLTYAYCQIPCADVSFTPSTPSVSTVANYHNPDAYLTVTLPQGFAAGTYTMTVYAEYTAETTYAISYWWLVVT